MRCLLVLFTFAFLLFTFIQPVQAQQISTYQLPLQTNPYLNPNTNPDVPQNLGTFTQSVLVNLIGAMMCQIIGINPADANQQCLGVDPQTGKIGFVPSASSGQGQGGGGAIGVFGNLIAMTFTPPASTTQYFAYMGSKFGIVEPAYAQGTGFTGITPIVKIWEVFRNLAYLSFVVAFVLIGLAIMLRVRIDPRTVMTIQNSIPKIIIALVLVTLSFAIAGFLIDMMYVIIYLVIKLLAGASPDLQNNLSTIESAMLGNNVIGFVNQMPYIGTAGITGILGIVTASAGAVSSIVAGLFSPGQIQSTNPNGVINVFEVLKNWLSFGVGNIFGGIAAVLAFLIIAIAVLWALFRLWFALIMAYVWLLLDIVFAPLWVLGGVIPGSPVGFGAWLRDILAHLSAFPTTIFMFILGKIFIDSFSSGGAFVPPLIGGFNTNVLGALIGLGVILLTPQVVNMVKDAVKAPKFPYGAAIGQAVGVGPAMLGGVTSAVASPYGTLAGVRTLRTVLGEGVGPLGIGGLVGFRRQSTPPETGP